MEMEIHGGRAQQEFPSICVEQRATKDWMPLTVGDGDNFFLG